MTLVPFNQQLNRLMLFVKDASGRNYQISWGDEHKTFTAAQLKQGVNLAAEFPINPFSSAFARVDTAIAAKQSYETMEVKDFFRRTNNNWSTEAIVAQTDKVVSHAEEEHNALVVAVRTAFAPVTHVIKITAQ
jgi:hypothetical protein